MFGPFVGSFFVGAVDFAYGILPFAVERLFGDTTIVELLNGFGYTSEFFFDGGYFEANAI
jgi:hypothetical protein